MVKSHCLTTVTPFHISEVVYSTQGLLLIPIKGCQGSYLCFYTRSPPYPDSRLNRSLRFPLGGPQALYLRTTLRVVENPSANQTGESRAPFTAYR